MPFYEKSVSFRVRVLWFCEVHTSRGCCKPLVDGDVFFCRICGYFVGDISVHRWFLCVPLRKGGFTDSFFANLPDRSSHTFFEGCVCVWTKKQKQKKSNGSVNNSFLHVCSLDTKYIKFIDTEEGPHSWLKRLPFSSL